MAIPKEVTRLVERFRENRGAYLSSEYNETQLRREFLDPFFKSLGWDVDNEQGYAEAYKDVIHEDAIKIERGTKAPDYAFRIGGTRKFFVEAKRPSVGIKDNIDAAYQLRRYAWSAKLPLSILTDFEEFAVYDTRVRPNRDDKASSARTFYFTYEEYEEKWDEIAGIFAPDAIRKGSFDKYVETKKMRGTAEVDDAFLAEIEGWRDALARNISLRNAGLSNREVNFAVQRTIDRLIFLRICEDRGIEEYGQLMSLRNGANVYQRLCQVFRDADDRYNSGLFHFRKEKGRAEAPDDLTLALDIDDKVLKEILASLYYPESPYEFSVLPADILGHIYEQFLGKVIRLTAGHRAVVEEKPEVRKAGGVYYTPTYIVDYIVEHTVGKLLEGKTPSQAVKLRVLDPACGSGSFLLGAYQRLLDWHLKSYTEKQPEKHAKGSQPKLFRGPGGDWRLTTSEKKRVLLNGIYGVDIDPQAVEVTKLSLLLKVLEGESDETLGKTLRMFHERALPDLGANIKCGNSLIGPDFYEGKQLSLIDEEERYRINAFDWHAEFPHIFPSPSGRGQGEGNGFDAVIGNPPYVYRSATDDLLRRYLSASYRCAEGNFDLYKFFLERGIHVVRPGGLLGMIVSSTFLILKTFQRLRELMLGETEIQRLAPLGPGVFRRATVDTAVIVLRKGEPADEHEIAVQSPRTPAELLVAPVRLSRQSRYASNHGNVFDYRLTDAAGHFVDRLLAEFPALGEAFEIGVGINTGFIRSELISNTRLDKRYHPMVPGSGISRYGKVETQGWILYDKQYVQSRGRLGRTLPPEHIFCSEKILVVRTRNLALPRRIVATLDRSGAYNLNRLSNIVSIDKGSLLGLLGILNSSLVNFLYSTRFWDYEIKPVYLRSTPIPGTEHSLMKELVEGMLALHAQGLRAKTTYDKNLIERQIDATDKQIDQLAYKLYGLTDEEIRIVEEATG